MQAARGAGAIANWKHGRYSARAEAEAAAIAELLGQARELTAEMRARIEPGAAPG